MNLYKADYQKIGIAIDCTPLERLNGGIGFYLKSLLSNLIHQRSDILFLLYSFSGHLDLGIIINQSNVKIISIKKCSFFHALWTQTSLALKLFLDNPDYFWSPTQLIPIFKRKNLKTIITIHDFVFLLHPKSMPTFRCCLMKFLSRSLFKKANYIFCNSHGTKIKLKNFYGISCSEVIIPPVKSTISAKTLYESQSFLTAHGFFHKNYILTTGSIEPRKNYTQLIEFYLSLFMNNDQNDIIPLVIIGGGGWKNEKIHQTISEAKNLYPSHIFHLGFVSDEDLSYAYSSAKFFLMFSLYEGYGMPLAEARTCRTPIICFDQDEMKEAAEYDGLFLDPINYYSKLASCFKKSNHNFLSVNECTYPSASEQADKISNFLR